MATKPFQYQEMFPLGPDTTEYYHLTSDYVKVEQFEGRDMLVVDPESLSSQQEDLSLNLSKKKKTV